MSDRLDRRAFVAYFSSIGLGGTLLPGALYALAQQEPRVTKEMLKQAEQLAGLEFTEAERDRMLTEDIPAEDIKTLRRIIETMIERAETLMEEEQRLQSS